MQTITFDLNRSVSSQPPHPNKRLDNKKPNDGVSLKQAVDVEATDRYTRAAGRREQTRLLFPNLIKARPTTSITSIAVKLNGYVRLFKAQKQARVKKTFKVFYWYDKREAERVQGCATFLLTSRSPGVRRSSCQRRYEVVSGVLTEAHFVDEQHVSL